jgi:hypothetical protein
LHPRFLCAVLALERGVHAAAEIIPVRETSPIIVKYIRASGKKAQLKTWRDLPLPL